DLLGIGHGVLLFFLALAAAVGLGLLATTRPELRLVDAARATLALLGWIVLVRRAPHLLDDHGPWAALGLAESIVLGVVLLPLAVTRVVALARGLRGAGLRARS